MLRSTALRRTADINSYMHKWASQVKRRDPNEKALSVGFVFVEGIKRYHSYFLALFIVTVVYIHNEWGNPEKVRAPVQDGRSLVT